MAGTGDVAKLPHGWTRGQTRQVSKPSLDLSAAHLETFFPLPEPKSLHPSPRPPLPPSPLLRLNSARLRVFFLFQRLRVGCNMRSLETLRFNNCDK